MGDLFDSLVHPEDRVVAVVGAGGKTSLMFFLAREWRNRGCTVITTTTTRIRYPSPHQSPEVVLPAGEKGWRAIRQKLGLHGHVTVAEHLPSSGGKLAGPEPAVLRRLLDRTGVDHLIIEADGARGLSLKAPGPREPVVPPWTDLFISLAGLDIIGRPLDGEYVFRPELVAARTGLVPGALLTPAAIASLALHPRGMLKGCPPGARSCIFLNKTDIPRGVEKALEVRKAARKSPGNKPDLWVAGSIHHGLLMVDPDSCPSFP